MSFSDSLFYIYSKIMVRIINGEIVQDNDPRLKQGNSSGGGRSAEMRPGRSNVRDVFSSSSSSGADGSAPPNSDPRQRAQQQQQQQMKQSNPLDMAAVALGIQDRFVTIPAVQQAGLSETRVGLIYIGVAMLGCFVFGYKAGLLAVGGYVLWKKSDGAETRT